MLHDRLLAWIALSDHEIQRKTFSTLFEPDAIFDSASHCEVTVLGRVSDTYAAPEDVRPILASGDSHHGVIVFEARDPVTNLWHRIAWAFVAQDGHISRVVETVSGGLHPPESREH